MAIPQKPAGWTAVMTEFVHNEVPEGEETDSIIILLVAEYRIMDGRVGKDWIEMLKTSVS